MADGQLISSPVRMFLNKIITPDQTPRLWLHGGHAITAEQAAEHQAFKPLEVLPYQSEVISINGARTVMCGTVLYFDLSSYPIEWYKPMRRVIPVVSWNLPNGSIQEAHRGAPPNPVNLGQPVAAWGWTALVTLGLAAGIWGLAYPAGHQIRRFWVTSRRWLARNLRPAVPQAPPDPIPIGARSSTPYCLLCSDDGHLSLSKVQIALWTLAIAAAVFFYGLVRIEVPSIPTSLVALMGLSFITGGFSYLAPPPRSTAPPAQRVASAAGVATIPDAGAVSAGAGAPVPPGQGGGTDRQSATPAPDDAARASVVPKLRDLVLNFPNDGPPQLSLARAQMLMWTLLLVLLFVSKSAVNGTLWDVPWELVALTGISQAGYVAPKFAGPGAGSTQT